jgi:hypothetical protein
MLRLSLGPRQNLWLEIEKGFSECIFPFLEAFLSTATELNLPEILYLLQQSASGPTLPSDLGDFTVDECTISKGRTTT